MSFVDFSISLNQFRARHKLFFNNIVVNKNDDTNHQHMT